jgi:hypothetical protein
MYQNLVKDTTNQRFLHEYTRLLSAESYFEVPEDLVILIRPFQGRRFIYSSANRGCNLPACMRNQAGYTHGY